MVHFYSQGLLLLVLIAECKDGSLVIDTVSTSQGEDVVLPCFNSYVMDPKSCYRVKLIKYATDVSQMKVILARPKTTKFQDAKRVQWEADGNGQMALLLTKSQKSDEGLYRCEIWQGWDCILVKNISLKVKDCKTLQAVKAAPCTPVNLNCPVDTTAGQQGHQNISWATLKGGNPVSVSSKRVVINETSLAIQCVNYSDSGWYRCKDMLGQTQRCFDIKLLVQVQNVVATTVPVPTTSEIIWETGKEESNVVFITVVASAIIGIAIMAALIGLFIYCRRNTRRVTQLTRRHPAVSTVDYEIVNLAPSEDRTNRANSLYQQFPDESLCTFQY